MYIILYVIDTHAYQSHIIALTILMHSYLCLVLICIQITMVCTREKPNQISLDSVPQNIAIVLHSLPRAAIIVRTGRYFPYTMGNHA